MSLEEFRADARGQRDQLRAERAARGEPIPSPAREWCIVAYRLETAGCHAGAADAWREALAADARIPLAHLGLARSLLGLGDPEAAVASSRAAIEAQERAEGAGVEPLLDDPDEDPWYCLGLAEHMAGRLDAAAAAYAKSAERFPWFPEPLFETARLELARGRREAAEEAGRQALKRAKWRPEFAREVEKLLEDAKR